MYIRRRDFERQIAVLNANNVWGFFYKPAESSMKKFHFTHFFGAEIFFLIYLLLKIFIRMDHNIVEL